VTHIRAEFAASKKTYGWPRIYRQLRSKGLAVGKERVRKAGLFSSQQIIGISRRKLMSRAAL
jgi:hypothetical protein